jgi:hypothetical protein
MGFEVARRNSEERYTGKAAILDPNENKVGTTTFDSDRRPLGLTARAREAARAWLFDVWRDRTRTFLNIAIGAFMGTALTLNHNPLRGLACGAAAGLVWGITKERKKIPNTQR